MSSLCEVYWSPVYAFIRRSGTATDEARDLTQAFFTRVLEKNYFKDADQDRGRFRTFLLAAVRHFLANHREAQRAHKRGRGFSHVPLEIDEEERRYHHEPRTQETPEGIYERRWALAVLDLAIRRLAVRYQDPERRALFEGLRPVLSGDEEFSYGSLSARLGIAEGALRVAAHRLRKHFAASLRDVIGETVSSRAAIDDELRYLIAVVSR